MQRTLPIFIGIITLCLFGGLCAMFWSEGRTYWAALFLGLVSLRTIVLIRQIINVTKGDYEEEERDDDAQPESSNIP